MRPTRYRLRQLAIRIGFGGAALLLLAAAGLDLALGEQVLLIAPHDAGIVELNRMLYLPEDPVVEIYGNPLSAPVRVILRARDRLIQPSEEPTLLLLPVDKRKGENPLQAKTVWFLFRHVAGGLILLGILGFFWPRFHATNVAAIPASSSATGRASPARCSTASTCTSRFPP